jgi:hypothetical protein
MGRWSHPAACMLAKLHSVDSRLVHLVLVFWYTPFTAQVLPVPKMSGPDHLQCRHQHNPYMQSQNTYVSRMTSTPALAVSVGAAPCAPHGHS